MENNYESSTHTMTNAKNIFIGLLIGGVAGTITMLLLAPQSGKRTRAQIQDKSIQLRDQVSKQIKKTATQVRTKTNQIGSDVREKAGELKQLGQDKIVKQMDRMTDALDAGKTAIEAA